jgi:uncharacterized membrane protein
MRLKSVICVLLLILLNSFLDGAKANLYISNKCYKAINFIIIAKDRDGDWVHAGWYHLDEFGGDKSEIKLGGISRNTFFIYAKTSDGKPFLTGNSKKRFKGSTKKYPFKRVNAKWAKRRSDGRISKILLFKFKCK